MVVAMLRPSRMAHREQPAPRWQLISRSGAERDGPAGLAFDFLESLPGEPGVMTGHASGLITINVAEADDDYREQNREGLREPYRTVLGHLRHELGHYYWDVLVRDSEWLEPYRELFGDERASYGDALNRHYQQGPPPDWANRYISSYSAMHPWEDWAETWAHFLHIRSTLETVTSYGLDTSHTPLRVTPFTRDVLYRHGGEKGVHVNMDDLARRASGEHPATL